MNFDWKVKKITPFALLYNLSKKQAVEFALILGRMCFILTSAIVCKYINVGYFIVLCLFSLFILFLNRNIKLFAFNLLNSFAIFTLLYVQSLLLNYYQAIENLFIIYIMLIMIGIFAVLYSLLQSLNAYEGLLKLND